MSPLPPKRLRFAPASAFLLVWIAGAAVLKTAHLPLIPKLGFALILTAAAVLLFLFPDSLAPRVRRGGRFVLLAGWLGFGMILAHQIDAPWTDYRANNGAVWSFHGRNIARDGFLSTYGVLYTSVGETTDPQTRIANHHPPGLVWTLAVLFKIFGPHEWVARSVPALFSLAGIAALLLWAWARLGPAGAGGVMLAAAACPALTYIGRMVNFEPLVLALSLVFYATLDLFPGSQKGRLLFGMACLAVAPAIGWVGAIWALIAAAFLGQLRFGRQRPALYLIPAIVILGMMLFLSYKVKNGAAGTLSRSLKWHTAFRANALPTPREWVTVLTQFLHNMVPWPLWFLLPLAALRAVREKLPKMLLAGTLLPFALLIPVMPYAFYVHDYHVMSLWPLTALLAGAVAAIGRRSRPVLLGFACLLLVPLAFGTRSYHTMHQTVDVQQTRLRLGKTLNRLIPPDATVALVYSKQPFTPVLWFYLARPFMLFLKPEKALALKDAWDYCALLSANPLSPEAETAFRAMTKIPVRGEGCTLYAKPPP